MAYSVLPIEFGLGLNNRDVDFDILPRQSSDLLNVYISSNDTIKTREGYDQYGDTISGSKASMVMGKYSYNNATGTITNSLYDVRGTDIYKYVAGTWTSQTRTLTTDTPGQFVQANNELYYFNGVDAVQNLSNTTWSSLASGTPMSGANNIGRYAVYRGGMLFVAGTNAQPNRVHVSGDSNGSLSTPEDFSGGWAYDFNTNDGSGQITGLAKLRGITYVFKEYGIYALAGVTGDTLYQDQKVEGIGCIAPKSIASDGDFIYFQAHDGHVYAFDGNRQWKISNVISGTITESLNTSKYANSVGVWDSINNYYILSCCATGASTTTYWLIFDISRSTIQTNDYNLRVFYVWSSIPAGSLIEFTATAGDAPSLYFGSSASTGKVYKMYGYTDDDGTAINSYYATKSYDADTPQLNKRYKFLHINTKQVGTWDLNVDYAIDGNGFSNTIPTGIDLTSSGLTFPMTFPWTFVSSFLVNNNMVYIPTTARYIKFKFSTTGTGDYFEIYNAEARYRTERLRLYLSTT